MSASIVDIIPSKLVLIERHTHRHIYIYIGRNTAIALPYFGIGRNLTVGNFFTDMELSAHLLANNMALVETVRRDKRFLPQEFQTGQGLKKGDAIFGFQKIKPQLLRINQIKKSMLLF